MSLFTPCLEHKCYQQAEFNGRCKDHYEPWVSDRRQRLPSDWQARRKIVMARAHGRCAYCGMPGASQVDHIENGDDHSYENLQLLCQDCHAHKTYDESLRGKGVSPKVEREVTPHTRRSRLVQRDIV